METGAGTDIIEQLLRLREIDHKRGRLKKKLDAVPKKLRRFTDALDAFDCAVEEQEQVKLAAQAEARRAELEVATHEEQRDKIKLQMNAPKLSNRDYEVLQTGLSSVLADINSLTTAAVKSMGRAEEAEKKAKEVRDEADALRKEYEEELARLNGSLSGVRDQLGELNAQRDIFMKEDQVITIEALDIYERIRAKLGDALAAVDGTIDRAGNRIGNDLHCSACYITITPNDAVQVIEGQRLIQCKSCVRILYVP